MIELHLVDMWTLRLALALCVATATSFYSQPRCHMRCMGHRRFAPPRLALPEVDEIDESTGRPVIEWYPGHIAKAERLMSEVLQMVDVVVELRDARAPIATTHPMLPTWIGSRGRVLVINRIDSVPERSRAAWERTLKELGEEPHFVDAKKGVGVPALKKAIMRAGARVN